MAQPRRDKRVTHILLVFLSSLQIVLPISPKLRGAFIHTAWGVPQAGVARLVQPHHNAGVTNIALVFLSTLRIVPLVSPEIVPPVHPHQSVIRGGGRIVYGVFGILLSRQKEILVLAQ